MEISISSLGWLASGSWTVTNVPTVATKDTINASGNVSVFIMGYQTPTSAMPTTGSAIYHAGSAAQPVGLGAFFNGNGGPSAALAGQIDITADFAGGTVNGTLTNTVAVYGTGTYNSNGEIFAKLPWNNVAMTGSISGNTISGTSSVTSNPANLTSIGPGATGTIKGGFYGPTADQIGLIWTLSDGKSAALGTITTISKSNVIVLP